MQHSTAQPAFRADPLLEKLEAALTSPEVQRNSATIGGAVEDATALLASVLDRLRGLEAHVIGPVQHEGTFNLPATPCLCADAQHLVGLAHEISITLGRLDAAIR